MHFKGWVRTSLIDYPERIATVLFVGGCNLRCPVCHNAGLVLYPESFPDVSEEEVTAWLERRVGLVDGMVLTGGEPTIAPDLLPFLRRLRARFPLAVKLDTNGYRPEVLGAVLAEGLVDYVAMDLKSPPEKYGLLSGRPALDVSRIERSIGLLEASPVAHEFRTTVVPTFLDDEDIEALARWLVELCGGPPSAPYVLQPFRPLHTLDPEMRHISPYPPERLRGMVARAGRYLDRVWARLGV